MDFNTAVDRLLGKYYSVNEEYYERTPEEEQGSSKTLGQIASDIGKTPIPFLPKLQTTEYDAEGNVTSDTSRDITLGDVAKIPSKLVQLGKEIYDDANAINEPETPPASSESPLNQALQVPTAMMNAYNHYKDQAQQQQASTSSSSAPATSTSSTSGPPPAPPASSTSSDPFQAKIDQMNQQTQQWQSNPGVTQTSYTANYMPKTTPSSSSEEEKKRGQTIMPFTATKAN